tara:strand:- start:2 stop:157 length:156 start_codon:yes stop_codon:yes gene_type:complete
MIVGKLYKYRNDYVLVLKKSRKQQIDRVSAYYALFPKGFIDIVPSSLLKRI